MRRSTLITAAVAASMASASAIASPASLLSLDRASSGTADSNAAVGGFLIPAIAVVAIIGGAIILSDDNDEPTSP